MPRTARVFLAVALLLTAAGVLWLLSEGNRPPTGGDGAADAAATDARVRVSAPRPNAVVSGPLEVGGEARGTWFFEADFPVRLLDDEGREIAAVPARAVGEWMTEEFVPYEATVPFADAATRTGVLVLERANPSGRADRAAIVAVPVRFSAEAPRRRGVRVFFNRSASDHVDCEAVWPVARTIDVDRPAPRAAVDELLRGPTAAERERGFLSSIPRGVRLRSLRVEGRTARADFGRTLDRAAGSCLVRAIRAQIERTLLQFPEVDDVVISVEGDVEGALQP